MSFVSADYLLHAANVLMLIAYSVRSILWLRVFAMTASVIAIPYYLLQTSVLWPPVGWSAVFILINLVQVCLILWQRRPIVLSEEEQKLYKMGFNVIRPRDFVSLVTVGRWESAVAGDKILSEGEPCHSLCVAISGTIQVRRRERTLGELGPGRIFGTAIALLGEPSPVDAVFIEPARYICWPVASIRTFLDRKPELRVALQRLAADDLAHKLELLGIREP